VPGFNQPAILIVNVLTIPTVAGVAVVVEQCFQLVDVIGGQRKVVALTELALGRKPGHLFTVVAMETVTADHCGVQPLTGKHPAENLAGGRGARSGRTGNRDDGMTF